MTAMNNDSRVIRDIASLNLRPHAREIAETLADKIDLPIVYLVDSEFDLNFAGRHSRHRNQYWVTVKPQTDQNEYERIILSGLYRGVEERKRILRARPHQDYLQKSMGSANEEKEKEYRGLINRINAVVTTVDAELYLKPLGYEVSEQQKQVQLRDRMRRLDEYLSMQAKRPSFRWFAEVELGNLLDYARIASWGADYANCLKARIRKIKPPAAAASFLCRLSKLTAVLQTVSQKQFDAETEEPAEWLLPQIKDILDLNGKVTFSREVAYVGTFRFADGRSAQQCSLVPEGIEDEKLMVCGMRSVNEALVLLQEYLAFCKNTATPDVVTNLIMDDSVNAYANGTRQDGYFISVTSGLIRFLHTRIEQTDFADLPACSDETKQLLEKFAIYYVAAHEYAHILGGDCDSVEPAESIHQEETANQTAGRLLSEALFLRRRMPKGDCLQDQVMSLLSALRADQALLQYACKWCADTLQNRT